MSKPFRAPIRVRAAAFLAALWLSHAPAPAAAQAELGGIATRFAIDDDDPERSVPTPEQASKAPLQMGYWAMLVSDKADAATRRGDHAAAAKYWRALAKAVPDRSVAYRRMCMAYKAAGDLRNALESCKAVLAKNGVEIEDYVIFVRLLLAKESALSAAEIAHADQVLAHVERELDEPMGAAADPAKAQNQARLWKVRMQQLRCELGLRIEDRARLDTCTKALAQLAPEDARTITFAYALAILKGDFARADSLIERGRRAGLPQQALEQMRHKLQTELEQQPWYAQLLQDAVWAAAGGVAAALAAVAAFIAVRRRRGLAQAT
jgi:hypothetical protein